MSSEDDLLRIRLAPNGEDVIVIFPTGREIFLWTGPMCGELLKRMLQSRMAEPKAKIGQTVGAATQAQLRELELELIGHWHVEPKQLAGKHKRRREILAATGAKVKDLPPVRRYDKKGRVEGLTLESLGLAGEGEEE